MKSLTDQVGGEGIVTLWLGYMHFLTLPSVSARFLLGLLGTLIFVVTFLSTGPAFDVWVSCPSGCQSSPFLWLFALSLASLCHHGILSHLDWDSLILRQSNSSKIDSITT